MKKIFIAFIAAAYLLGGCSKDDNTTGEVTSDQISLSQAEVSAAPAGGTSQITVTSSGDWRLAGTCDWVHPSAVAGKTGDSVTFTIDPNDTEVVREATLKFFTGAAVTTLKFTSEAGYVLNLQTDSEVNFSRAKSSLVIKVQTNIPDPTATIAAAEGEEWLVLDQHTNNFGVTAFYFSLTENTTLDNRSRVVTIAGQGHSITVKVNQLQTDTVELETLLYKTGLAGGEVRVDLGSNFDYQVEIPEKYAAWIHRVEAKNGTRGVVAHTETFTIDPAQGLRGGKIYFTKADGSYSRVITIRQGDAEPILATIPDAGFRAWLEENDYVIEIDGPECELTPLGLNATEFNLNGSKAKSVAGITVFTKLTSLICNRANSLETIPLGDLDITSVVMSTNTNLRTNIVISSSKLTSFDVNNSIYLPSLDVSGCPALDTLNISDCYEFLTLTLKTGQTFTTFSDNWTGFYAPDGKYVTVYK